MPFYKSLRSRKNRSYAPRAVDRLLALRRQIRRDLPGRTLRQTLLLATWNIRDFDCNKFRQGPRLEESYYYIAEVIAGFDLVAIQEVNDDLGPLKRVMSILGPNWDYIVTDVTEGASGNGERMAFVFDRRKILFRHIVGEIVLPTGSEIGGEAVDIKLPEESEVEFTKAAKLKLPDGTTVDMKKGDTIELPAGQHEIHLPEGQKVAKLRQFARTPFLVAFQAGWFKFSLCTVHLYYGSSSGAGFRRRVKEIDAIGKFFKKRADAIRKREKTGENFILLGDFNIVEPADDTFKALKKNGFEVPQGVHKSNVRESMFYDQIAFHTNKGELQLGPSDPNSGVFKFFNSVYRGVDFEAYHDLMKNKKLRDFHSRGRKKGQPRTKAEKKTYYQNEWRTWQLSDHYPLWVELEIDFSDAYLKRVGKEVAS